MKKIINVFLGILLCSNICLAKVQEKAMTFDAVSGHSHDGVNGGKKVNSSNIVVTPAGNISSSDSQSALNELDTYITSGHSHDGTNGSIVDRPYVASRNYATFGDALTAAVNKTLVVDSTVNVTTNTQIASTIGVVMQKSGLFNISNGVTLTIGGELSYVRKQIFSGTGTVVFTGTNNVLFPEWWGASPSASAATNTSAIQACINASESNKLKISFGYGVYAHNGLTLSKGIWIEGIGWGTVLDNYGSTHSLARIGGADQDTQGVKISDIAFECGNSSGATTDGLHFEYMNNHLRLDRVRVLNAPRHGIHLVGGTASYTGTLYTVFTQLFVNGAGTDGIHIDGGVNGGFISGGRIGSNGAYGINLQDSITGSPGSYPNSWVISGVDLAGNTNYGVRDDGHSNTYVGVRFESNTIGTYLFDTNCNNSQVFGFSNGGGSATITNNAAARPVMWSKLFYARTFNASGFLEYYDEADGAIRKLPRKGVISERIEAVAAGSGLNASVYRVEDPVTITGIWITPDASVTGNDTNYFRLGIRISDGTGGTGTICRYDIFTSGTDMTAYVPYNLLDKDAGGASLSRASGDLVIFEKLETLAGMNMPALLITIEYKGT